MPASSNGSPRGEALPGIEADRAVLGVQQHLGVAARARHPDQRVQQRGTDARTALVVPHRHAADPGHARCLFDQPAGAQRQPEAVAGHGMHRAGVGGVPFQFGRDALFLHEDRVAQHLGLAPDGVPGAGAHVEHGLAAFVGVQHVAQRSGTGREVCVAGSAKT